MSAFTPIGNDWQTVSNNLCDQQSGIQRMHEWDEYAGLHAKLGAPVHNFTLPDHYTRKKIRSMGRVALMAVRASERALEQADLLHHPVIHSGRTGVAYGSSVGSTQATADFTRMLYSKRLEGFDGNTYLKMMGHTTVVNIGLFFKTSGRIIPAVSACTSGSQAIGFAFEAIRSGLQDVMIAGGAEELCPTEVAIFDTLYATSTRNDQPQSTPRPYDKDRDGLVIGEGACSFVLEALDHALARGATIHAEILGFATNSDGAHATQPTQSTMQQAMQLALDNAGLNKDAIGYISAHATATKTGDIAESQATFNVFGAHTPVSSLKSYTGHTLGACGAIESWVAIQMMQTGRFHPTLNLESVDDKCANLDYIVGDMRTIDCDIVMNNNFAFGGINTSLIFKKWQV
ncbi:MAG TPA: beta-ketoacyl-ACP synthase [Crenotrichaceae bacterium]|nr:beta-ketoacyl-ACP synthase [Crenotrichaceae bacterium]